MTRDDVAARVMAGFAANPQAGYALSVEGVASCSAKWADTLLAELARTAPEHPEAKP